MYSSRNYWSLSSRVSPFGYPRINLLPTSRGFSQVATSFFASQCQGIRRTPLLAWSKNFQKHTHRSEHGLGQVFIDTLVEVILCFKLPCIQLSKIDAACDLLYRENLSRVRSFRYGSRKEPTLSTIPVGGDDRDRTDDLRLAKPALSQLSYIPIGIHSAELPASAAQPEGQSFKWWAREESNFRPPHYQCGALTN